MTPIEMNARKFQALIYSRSHKILSIREKETVWEFLKS
jgi:hypothetical protein